MAIGKIPLYDNQRGRIEPCDLCDQQVLRQVAEEAGYFIYQCEFCDLVQVQPLPGETKEVNQRYWHVDVMIRLFECHEPAVVRSS